MRILVSTWECIPTITLQLSAPLWRVFYQVYGGRDIVGENYRTLSVKRTMKFCNVSIYSTIVPLVQDIFIFRLAAKTNFHTFRRLLYLVTRVRRNCQILRSSFLFVFNIIDLQITRKLVAYTLLKLLWLSEQSV